MFWGFRIVPCIYIKFLFIAIKWATTRTFGHVRPAKIQISLRIRAFWSESPLGTFFYRKGCKVSSCGQWSPEQSAWMHMLFWVFVGRTCQKIRRRTLRLGSNKWLYCVCEVSPHSSVEDPPTFENRIYTVKRSHRFYGKYWQLAASTYTLNFTGAADYLQ